MSIYIIESNYDCILLLEALSVGEMVLMVIIFLFFLFFTYDITNARST